MAKNKFEISEDAISEVNTALFSNMKEQPQEQPRNPVGRPRRDDVVHDKTEGPSRQIGLRKNTTRTSFIITLDLLDRINNYAYTERISVREAYDRLLNMSLDKEEKRLQKAGIEILEKPKKQPTPAEGTKDD